MHRPLLAIACAGLFLTAGCSATSAPDPVTPEADAAADVSVEPPQNISDEPANDTTLADSSSNAHATTLVEGFETQWVQRPDSDDPREQARRITRDNGGVMIGNAAQLVNGESIVCIDLGEELNGPLTYSLGVCPTPEMPGDLNLDTGTLLGVLPGNDIDRENFISRLSAVYGAPDLDTDVYVVPLDDDEPYSCYADTSRQVLVYGDLVITLGSWDGDTYALWEWSVGAPSMWNGRFSYPAPGIEGVPWAYGPVDQPILVDQLDLGATVIDDLAIGAEIDVISDYTTQPEWMELQPGLLWREHDIQGVIASSYLITSGGEVVGFGTAADGC